MGACFGEFSPTLNTPHFAAPPFPKDPDLVLKVLQVEGGGEVAFEEGYAKDPAAQAQDV